MTAGNERVETLQAMHVAVLYQLLKSSVNLQWGAHAALAQPVENIVSAHGRARLVQHAQDKALVSSQVSLRTGHSCPLSR